MCARHLGQSRYGIVHAEVVQVRCDAWEHFFWLGNIEDLTGSLPHAQELRVPLPDAFQEGFHLTVQVSGHKKWKYCKIQESARLIDTFCISRNIRTSSLITPGPEHVSFEPCCLLKKGCWRHPATSNTVWACLWYSLGHTADLKAMKAMQLCSYDSPVDLLLTMAQPHRASLAASLPQPLELYLDVSELVACLPEKGPSFLWKVVLLIKLLCLVFVVFTMSYIYICTVCFIWIFI